MIERGEAPFSLSIKTVSSGRLGNLLDCERRMQVDLLKFCHPTTTMHNIDKPFSRGEWTYATDGKIAIRVPRIDGYDEDNGPENIEQMFNEAEFARAVTVWQPLPKFKLMTKECDWCNSKGYVKHCNAYGNPEVKCGNGAWKKCEQYNDDCTVGCDATDKGAILCEECFGSGVEKVSAGTVVKGAVGKTKINAIYLDMIKDLPNVQIAPHDENSFFRIKFDGGEGLLMPMYPDW